MAGDRQCQGVYLSPLHIRGQFGDDLATGGVGGRTGLGQIIARPVRSVKQIFAGDGGAFCYQPGA
jgi:hypothetical protein